MRIKEVKLYHFNELSAEAQDNAIENLSYINTDDDWYQSTYEDANESALLTISEFDIDRYSIKGNFIESAEDSANAIVKNHGDMCDTFKTATNYLKELSTLKGIHSVADMDDEDLDTDEIDKEFLHAILEDYLVILRKEFEYQNSREAIIETIEANEYEFTEDGKLSH